VCVFVRVFQLWIFVCLNCNINMYVYLSIVCCKKTFENEINIIKIQKKND